MEGIPGMDVSWGWKLFEIRSTSCFWGHFVHDFVGLFWRLLPVIAYSTVDLHILGLYDKVDPYQL